MSARKVSVLGVGVALPGVDGLDGVTAAARGAAPVVPADRLGRRGLRYKDRATQLALCAAKDALAAAGLFDSARVNVAPANGKPVNGEQVNVAPESIGVVVSSNTGNMDTVCRVAATIADQGVTGTSPMDLPNASSNVVASSIAIRFGLRGPNAMVCNGATSGLDAVHWAATLIRAGRAERMLVVGVETANDVVSAVTGEPVEALLDGAAAVLLTAASGPGAVTVGRYTRSSGLSACADRLGDDRYSAWFVPEKHRGGAPRDWLAEVPRHDVAAGFGRCSGALGLVQAAAATGWLEAGNSGPVLLTAGDDATDGVAGLVLSR